MPEEFTDLLRHRLSLFRTRWFMGVAQTCFRDPLKVQLAFWPSQSCPFGGAHPGGWCMCWRFNHRCRSEHAYPALCWCWRSAREFTNFFRYMLSRYRTRIHPIAVLSALLTYRAGKGARGHHTWTPVPQVVDALDKAFERSFDTAPQTNQRFYLGRPSDRESWPARGVLSESKSHSPWSECDISAGQLARTFPLDVDIVAVEKCTVLCHP